MKKVILILIDSMLPEILEDCFRNKTVPALKFLKERGRYWNNCVTVFPTMTASVDSSLFTGVYPDRHRIPGLIWYDPEAQKVVNYVNGWSCVRKLGLSECAENVLFRLNQKHLSRDVTTLFEELSERGKASAAINALVHRGKWGHRVRLPLWFRLLTGFRGNREIYGPEFLTLGAIVDAEVRNRIPRKIQRFFRYWGINDAFAVEAAKMLLRSDPSPDFLFVYLPDNDHQVHRKNPVHAADSLIQADRKIQEILDVFGTWEEALDKAVFIVVSDHGQTRIGNGSHFNIDLDRLLRSFSCLRLGEKVQDGHDLVVCNNERMTYLYPLKSGKQEAILDALLKESRMDIVAWKEGTRIRVMEGGSRRELVFQPGGPFTDPYGAEWAVAGDWAVLDLKETNGRIAFGDYPDVLARLYGALHSQDVPIIVITARPRYEFKNRYYPTHLGGGSHGSLHKSDSLVPLIVAGTDQPLHGPPRLVDLKRFILQLFDQGKEGR